MRGPALAVLCGLALPGYGAAAAAWQEVKTETWFIGPVALHPGEISNLYYDLPMPSRRSTVGVVSFNADMVYDDRRTPVPLDRLYQHHWVVGDKRGRGNAGLCANTLGQLFGLGSEARRTNTTFPYPYVLPLTKGRELEVNLHLIDLRDVVSVQHCIECRCNITHTQPSNPPPYAHYEGGLLCCNHGDFCQNLHGRDVGPLQTYYLRYTVVYVELEGPEAAEGAVPVDVYVMDVTGNMRTGDECIVEYQVEPSDDASGRAVLKNEFWFDSDVDIVFAVGHQHAGGEGIALLREDGGEVLCDSRPRYGTTRHEAGNEAGFVVAMSTCAASGDDSSSSTSGPWRIQANETLHMVSRYRGDRLITGVMGLFYIAAAKA